MQEVQELVDEIRRKRAERILNVGACVPLGVRDRERSLGAFVDRPNTALPQGETYKSAICEARGSREGESPVYARPVFGVSGLMAPPKTDGPKARIMVHCRWHRPLTVINRCELLTRRALRNDIWSGTCARRAAPSTPVQEPSPPVR